ncbi:hypothetical protein M6B38_177850 [Iris pallida]|uniref:Uncharacterized protein n=1 Tax=Iris pallida TaxID=29817 RepID=A0AAX6ENY9_IRIPA|nr:hypothetical protein M6B38_177850 [Iris pallida]
MDGSLTPPPVPIISSWTTPQRVRRPHCSVDSDLRNQPSRAFIDRSIYRSCDLQILDCFVELGNSYCKLI